MKPTAIDIEPIKQTGMIITDPILVGGKSTPVFEITPTDWVSKNQSMVVRIQISVDGGKTWTDKMVCPVPEIPESGLAPYSVTDSLMNIETGEKFPIPYDLGTLTRCICEVTGDITFGIKGSVK